MNYTSSRLYSSYGTILHLKCWQSQSEVQFFKWSKIHEWSFPRQPTRHHPLSENCDCSAVSESSCYFCNNRSAPTYTLMAADSAHTATEGEANRKHIETFISHTIRKYCTKITNSLIRGLHGFMVFTNTRTSVIRDCIKIFCEKYRKVVFLFLFQQHMTVI